MYQGTSGQDWTPVVFKKKTQDTQKQNKPQLSGESIRLNKIADETDIVQHKKVSTEQAKAISKGRVEKKMTQADLAKALNMNVKDIADIEKGTAIYNGAVIAKIKRVLGI